MKEAGIAGSRTLMRGNITPAKSMPAPFATSRRMPRAFRMFGTGRRVLEYTCDGSSAKLLSRAPQPATSPRMPRASGTSWGASLTEPRLREPICTNPRRSVLAKVSKARERTLPQACETGAASEGGIAALKGNVGGSIQDAKGPAASTARDLGRRISEAIDAIREFSMKSKGLHNKHKGKFDDRWLEKWRWWYSYVRAMCIKPWNAAKAVLNGAKAILANSARAVRGALASLADMAKPAKPPAAYARTPFQ